MIVDVIPKFVSDGKVFLLDFHASFDRFSSFHSFLDNFMHLIEVDSCLSNEIVVPNKISIPYLHCKDVRIHIFRFGRIENWEFKSIIETSN